MDKDDENGGHEAERDKKELLPSLEGQVNLEQTKDCKDGKGAKKPGSNLRGELWAQRGIRERDLGFCWCSAT